MASIAIPFLPAGFNVGSSPLPTVSVTPAPATIPIGFISDLAAAPSQIVGTLRTGIPFDESVSGGGIQLPLTPLPTAQGARVSHAGAYPLEYQTAGSNMIAGAATYATALGTYNAALSTLYASTSYATFLSSTATYDGAYTTFQNATFAFGAAVNTFESAVLTLALSSAYATWFTAGQPSSGPIYNTYIASAAFVTYSAASTAYVAATATWSTAGTTFASAVTAAGGASLGAYFQSSFNNYYNAYLFYASPNGGVYNYAYGEFQQGLITAAAYTAASNTYAAQGATFIAATNTFNAILNSVTNSADATAYGVLAVTGAFGTWLTAYTVALGAYATWVPQYNVAQSALNWWQTFASAVNFANGNQLSANPYSSVNPV